MEKQISHTNHLLTYALNAEGNLVHVDSVDDGFKCGCICPCCKEPLIARQGDIKCHHFAHKSGTECEGAYESMLHLLAKDRIQAAFLTSPKFLIMFEYRSYCPKNSECLFIRHDECFDQKVVPFDLKTFYDSCEQEVAYDNVRRRSDLKFFSKSNPNRKPIYIEFWVTHQSDSAKLHSNNRIIEIYLQSESDINVIVEQGMCESSSVKFYNFRNKDINNITINRDIDFFRYVLYGSGKSLCREDGCNCKQLGKRFPSSLLEICVHTIVGFNIYEYLMYVGYQRFKIPNCILCVNYVNNYNGTGKICRFHKSLQIPLYEPFDTARAKNCPRFGVNKAMMDTMLKNGLDDPMTEF